MAGIDLGKTRVGVAIAEDLESRAEPRYVLDGRDRHALLRSLAQLAEAEGIERFVVGLPLEMSGAEGTAARRARRFARTLERATGRPIELWDERLTTAQALRQLEASGASRDRARKRVDAVAAALLLQAWLDGRRRE